MSSTIDLGLVTAYGYAKAQGFTGTENEFAQMLANIVVYKNAAETSANNAALSAGLAEQYKDEAFDTTPAGYTDFVSNTNSSLTNMQTMGAKNLFNLDNTKTLRGVTVEVINESSIKVEKSDTTTWRQVEIFIPNVSFLAGRQITFSCGTPQINGPDYSDWRIYLIADSSTELGYINDSTRNKTVTIPSEATTLRFYLRLSQTNVGSVGDYIIFHDIQLELGSQATFFTPYAQSNVALTEETLVQDLSTSIQAETGVTTNFALVKIGKLVMLYGYAEVPFDGSSEIAVCTLPESCKPISRTAPRFTIGVANEAYEKPIEVGYGIINISNRKLVVKSSQTTTKKVYLNVCFCVE